MEYAGDHYKPINISPRRLLVYHKAHMQTSSRRLLLAASVLTLLVGGLVFHWNQTRLRRYQASLSPEQKAYDTLVRISETPVNVQMHNGIMRSFAGEVPVKGATPAERAANFVKTAKPLYRLSNDLDLVPKKILNLGEGEVSVRFEERYRNIPVFGAELVVLMNDKVAYSAQGSLLNVESLSIEPVLTSVQAIERLKAKEKRSKLDLSAEPMLEIFDPAVTDAGSSTPSNPRLAWRLIIRNPQPREVHLDAEDGRVLLAFNTAMEAYELDLQHSNGSYADWDNACYRLTYADDYMGDQNGMLRRYHSDRDGVAAWFNFRDTYTFFNRGYGMDSYDNDGEDIEVYVHAGGPVVNAAARYMGDCDLFEFSNGNVALDIAAHEFTHAIIGQSSRLIYQNQSGALNESFADIFGALAEGDWLIGERSTGGGGAFRDMSEPRRFGHPDAMPPRMITADNGGVHTNSGIHNKVAFLLAEGGVHRAIEIQGIGRIKMGRLMFNLMRTLPRSAQMNDARNQAVAIAERWARAGTLGFTARDVCQVKNAYGSAGFTTWRGSTEIDTNCDGIEDLADADADSDSIPDSRDNCPSVRNIDQRDTDNDREGDACDDNIDGDGLLNWGDNCPTVPNDNQMDANRNGIGDACEDQDRDGIVNGLDNCWMVPNPDQMNRDNDALGDVCDDDNDNDGINNQADNCSIIPNRDQADQDRDSRGDVCDNCPRLSNADQRDRDRDGLGDACDPDRDGDGIPNDQDQCPDTSICPTAGLPSEATFQIPATPAPDPFRIILTAPFVPSRTQPRPPEPKPTCIGLRVEGASKDDAMWVSDEEGQLIGRFKVDADGKVFAKYTAEADQSYSLNYVNPKASKSVRTIKLRADNSICEQPAKPAVRAATKEFAPPADELAPKTSIEKTNEKQVPSTEKSTPSYNPTEKVVPDYKKDEYVDPKSNVNPITNPLKEIYPTPTEKKEPAPSPTPVPKQEPAKTAPEPEPAPHQPPWVEILSVEPSADVYYGACTTQPTSARVTFITHSDTQLVTLGATASVSRDYEPGTNWRTLQLYSLSKDRFSITIDPKGLIDSKIDGSNGWLFYRFLLIDREGLRDEKTFRLPLTYCQPIIEKK